MPDPASMAVLNVLLSSDAADQTAAPYSLRDLEQIARDLAELSGDLSKLVMRREL